MAPAAMAATPCWMRFPAPVTCDGAGAVGTGTVPLDDLVGVTLMVVSPAGAEVGVITAELLTGQTVVPTAIVVVVIAPYGQFVTSGLQEKTVPVEVE